MATERMIVWAGVGQPELARRSATGIEPASLRRHPLHPRRRSRREAPRVRYGVSPSSARCLSENAANRYWHMIPCSTSAAWHSMSISASRCSTTNGASGSARPPRVARTSARRPRPALPVGSLIQGHLPSSGLVGRKAARRTGPSRSAREKRRLPDAAPQPKEYLRPGASNVGSVSRRHPSTSIRTVGPPLWVSRTPLRACSAAPRARAPSRARSRRPSPSPATRAAGAAPRTP
jgi:hypothetical protein